jgi:hypothetical protein
MITESSNSSTHSRGAFPASILSISMLLAAMALVFTSSPTALFLVFAISFGALTAVAFAAWLATSRAGERDATGRKTRRLERI